MSTLSFPRLVFFLSRSYKSQSSTSLSRKSCTQTHVNTRFTCWHTVACQCSFAALFIFHNDPNPLRLTDTHLVPFGLAASSSMYSLIIITAKRESEQNYHLFFCKGTPAKTPSHPALSELAEQKGWDACSFSHTCIPTSLRAKVVHIIHLSKFYRRRFYSF